jgi:hypothetical protein
VTGIGAIVTEQGQQPVFLALSRQLTIWHRNFPGEAQELSVKS